MRRIKNTGLIYGCAAALMAIASGVAWYTPTVAGEPQKKTPTESTPTLFVEVVRLKNASANNIAQALQSAYADSVLRLAADPATNSLIIRAPADRIREIREMLGKLDVEAEDATAARKISVFDLRSVEPNKALDDALRVAIPENSPGNFALDPARKTVIVSADTATTEAVRSLLSRLESLGTARGGEDYLVRVVWLLNGQVEGQKMPAPPNDLKEALAGLAKFGLDQPRVAAQLVVNAQPNSSFQVKSVAENQVTLSVSGRLNGKTSPLGLEVTIQAATEPPPRKEVLCNLQTEISAPVGHLVVLGVTPFGQSPSAFVVQVLSKEGSRQVPTK